MQPGRVLLERRLDAFRRGLWGLNGRASGVRAQPALVPTGD